MRRFAMRKSVAKLGLWPAAGLVSAALAERARRNGQNPGGYHRKQAFLMEELGCNQNDFDNIFR